MRYTIDESMDEIRKRSQYLIQKKLKKKCCLLAVSTGFLMVLFMATVLLNANENTTPLQEATYGAFLLGEDYGGYVIVGVVTFLAGMTITLLCTKHNKKK